MATVLISLLCIIQIPVLAVYAACRNPHPLGMTNSQISDWQLSASSTHPSCRVKFARLHQMNNQAWCPKTAQAGEWLLIDLGVKSQITGILTQGRNDESQWVTAFTVMYSQDAYQWNYVLDIYGKKKYFSANSNSLAVRHNYFDRTIGARFLKIGIEDWHVYPSLRVELLGCQECNHIISVFPYAKVSSNLPVSKMKNHACHPEYADIHGHGAWCAKFGGGTITKGLGGFGRKCWVRSYALAYSNDSDNWYFYKDSQYLDMKIFGGNMDKHTERRHYVNKPFTSRYVRFYPLTWHKQIAMRAAIIGCPHTGDCGEGFFTVNDNSQCVENLAYKKSTWINDRRSSWKEWQYGHSSLATDGDLSVDLSRCAIIDNYYSEVPMWVVDLKEVKDIEGIVVYTWKGEGQGKTFLKKKKYFSSPDKTIVYDEYVRNLDMISIYCDYSLNLTNSSIETSSQCGFVKNQNRALFNPRLHIQCPRTLKGRYVYVKAIGSTQRWARIFNMILCEVLVY